MVSLRADARRDFSSLDEREILSLAIAAEEEDGRIYSEFAMRLHDLYPASAALLEGMAEEEDEHRRRLLDLYVERFGDRLVPIRREHVRGFLTRKPVWLQKTLTLEQARQEVWEMEEAAYRFYLGAASQVTDVGIRKLLGDLAAAEKGHSSRADKIDAEVLGAEGRETEKGEAHRQLLLTHVQPRR